MNSGINFRMPLCRRGCAKQGVDFRGWDARAPRSRNAQVNLRIAGGSAFSVSFHTRSGVRCSSSPAAVISRISASVFIGDTETKILGRNGRQNATRNTQRKDLRQTREEHGAVDVPQIPAPVVRVINLAVIVARPGGIMVRNRDAGDRLRGVTSGAA